jgi:signal transduction histidine kinase
MKNSIVTRNVILSLVMIIVNFTIGSVIYFAVSYNTITSVYIPLVTQRYTTIIQQHYAKYHNVTTLADTILTNYRQFVGEAFKPPMVSDAQGQVLYPADHTPTTINLSDYPYRSTVYLGDGNFVYVVPSTSFLDYPPMDQYPVQFLLAFFSMTIIAIIFNVITMYFSTMRILRPLFTLTKLSMIPLASPQHFTTQLGSNTILEFAQLAHALDTRDNEIMRQIQLQRQLNADISHELRNPLNVINGYIEAMRDGVLPATPNRLAIVHAEIQMLYKLVHDLRTLSLAEVDQLMGTLIETPLDSLLSEAYESLAPLCLEKNIAFTYTGNIPNTIVSIDKMQLQAALYNIIDNAIRHTALNGTITINATTTADSACIAISDNGTGIAPNDIAHLFARFNRGSNPIGTGSGLGLAIVHAIITAHRGTITLASTLGIGTTVTIILPLHSDTFNY